MASRQGAYQGNVASPGNGLTSATGVAAAAAGFTVQQTLAQTPLILPGLFTAINAESARPVDRFFFSYGYFDNFRVANGTGGTRPGFDLHRWDVGAEKTFLDGNASVYVRVPFLYAVNNSSPASLDGLGDISAGIKAALLVNCETGSALSAGFTVSAPTARDLVVSSNTSFFVDPATNLPLPGNPRNQNGLTLPDDQTERVNPTFLQPWLAGLLVLEDFFVQAYVGVVIPTDDRVSTFVNTDVGVGYTLYRNSCSGSLLTSVTPTVNAQALLPLNHQGTSTGSVNNQVLANGSGTADLVRAAPVQPLTLNASYQVFVSGGVQLGIGEKALLSVGAVTPVVGPKAYNVGGTVGFSFFY